MLFSGLEERRWPAQPVASFCSGGNFMLASPDSEGPQERTVERALLLLEGALQIIDDWGDCPDIGARLQHVIDCVDDRRRAQ
jgi:hypothetical protein